MADELILVADDDPGVARFIELNLTLEGFEVVIATDGREALREALERRPDLILLDIRMPGLDGVQVVERLRSDVRARTVPVIILTAESLSADRVVGLTAGADDYMIKPFDPVELIARVKSTLRRSREMRDVNPLTRLPGNLQVQDEIGRRLGAGERLALLYVDIDNFKAFNDYYGFLRGDRVISALATLIVDSVDCVCGRSGAFVGHVGGDDLVVICDPERAEELARSLISGWDAAVAGHYDPADAERGYIEVPDRRKQPHRFPLMTLSIGIVTNTRRPLAGHWEAVEIATEMKRFAKREARSNYALDRRTGAE